MDESGEDYQTREEVARDLSQYDNEHLINEYEQLSEEIRYRDGLMHNSYYLLTIAVVFFLGNVISWTAGDVDRIFEVGFVALFFSSGGVLLVLVSVVMGTYNEKRNRAESRRSDIEEALKLKIMQSDTEQSPYEIQRFVLRNDVPTHWTRGENRDEWIDSGTVFANIFGKGRKMRQKVASVGLSNYESGMFVAGSLMFAIGIVALAAEVVI